MKAIVKSFVFILVATFLFSGILLAAESTAQGEKGKLELQPRVVPGKPGVVLPKKCCIAGSYEGVYEDKMSKSCPEPKKARFAMDIKQDRLCGSAVIGVVKNLDDGTAQDFKGMVTPGREGCCNLSGQAKKQKEVTDFKGIFCKKGEKWIGKGDFKTIDGKRICNGVWTMEQK